MGDPQLLVLKYLIEVYGMLSNLSILSIVSTLSMYRGPTFVHVQVHVIRMKPLRSNSEIIVRLTD